MIEFLGLIEGPVTWGSVVLAIIYFVTKVLNLKGLVKLWSEHHEMRATARLMRAEGASAKQVARFLADHAIARAGRSP